MDSDTEMGAGDDRRNKQVDNAIRAIQEKKPIPEIDFTIHTMEDGTQVNTMERVCKGASDGDYPTTSTPIQPDGSNWSAAWYSRSTESLLSQHFDLEIVFMGSDGDGPTIY